MRNFQRFKIANRGLAVIAAGVIFISSSVSSLAATGTVTSSNVKVRAEASTSSEQVSSLDSGDTVDIIDETTDSQGYVWYHIKVDGNGSGYIRSDLVSKSGSTSSSTSTETAAAQPETTVTAVESQSGTVTVESANVRQGAGTGYETVGTVKNGDTVTITGEANGTDSKKWFQITFGDGKTGFVRADLVQPGAAAPAENAEATGDDPQAAEATTGEVTLDEEGNVIEGGEAVEGQEAADPNANAEVPVDTSVGNGEFSLAYKDDGTGTEVWYLYDNVEGTQVKLNDLLNYAAAGQQADQLREQTNKLKVVLIVLAVIIALLVLALLLLIYRLRDAAYYEEPEEPVKTKRKDSYDDLPAQKTKKKPVDLERMEQPRSKGRTIADSKNPERGVTAQRDRKPARMGSAEALLGYGGSDRLDKSDRMDRQERPERVERTVSRPSAGRMVTPEEPAKPVTPQPSARKPRNFLLEDDDFEFEFLDLDDDDK